MAWNLPGYGTPQAINFAPIGNALTGIRQQRNVEAEQARKNMLLEMQKQQMAQANAKAAASAARADKRMAFDERRLEADLAMRRENMGLQRERMGMDRERFGMQRQQFDDQRNERLAAKRGQLAMLADTPEKWAKLSQSVPEFAGKTREQVIAEGGQGGAYLDYQMKLRKAQSPNLSSTAMKEISGAEEVIQAGRDSMQALDAALRLNEKAYAGFGASERAALVNNTAGAFVDRPGALATQELDNLIQSQALQSLRTIFGGNPTEGERKILLDLAGSSSQPAQVRRKIFERARKLAEQRIRLNMQKAEALRAGTYYRPGGMPAALNEPITTQQRQQPAAGAANDPLGIR